MAISVSLGNGSLLAEIPHEEGSHTVSLPIGRELEAIIRILQSQLNAAKRNERALLGLEAAPSNQEVEHNLKHGMFPVETCPFCKLLAARATRAVSRSKRTILAVHGGVTITRVQAQSRKIKKDKITDEPLPTLDELFGPDETPTL